MKERKEKKASGEEKMIIKGQHTDRKEGVKRCRVKGGVREEGDRGTERESERRKEMLTVYAPTF